MPVISSERDTQAVTLTITVKLKADPGRVWQLWQDPRRLERWWGPPGWPATFLVHELRPGGSSNYFMTSPNGERAPGWWRVIAVDEPRGFEFDDGFSDQGGAPDPAMPTTHGRVELKAEGGVTRMILTSRWDSVDDMNRLLDMGMEEGMKLALGQMDGLLDQG
jgi:uncharacterized protein YndB with AHSA1/START domain